jgi:hypothetical protein
MSCTSTSSSASASTSTSSTTASTSSLAALNSDDTSNDHQPPSSVDGLAMKGFLLKLGARWKTWKRRWFALKQGTTLIEYYKSQDEKESPQGSIDLTMITSIEECENNLNLKKEKSEWAFQIVTGSRTYYLVAPDESTMRYWINGLREVCFCCTITTTKAITIWRIDKIHEADHAFVIVTMQTPAALSPSPSLPLCARMCLYLRMSDLFVRKPNEHKMVVSSTRCVKYQMKYAIKSRQRNHNMANCL